MKKLLTLLVVAAMVLCLASTAFAADVFGDITSKSDVQKDAITKLNALEIIAGYPDGTFKPDNTITRAEFAKITVIMAGLENSADVLKNTPAQFTDVKNGVWYTGYINLAASQGYVKGYPDGTFKPSAQISYAEVVTVLMRVLGYNDNLPGAWPIDYIVKGAALGVTDDVAFNSSAAATRADVAVLGSATLDQEEVTYSKDEDTFNLGGVSLLDKNFANNGIENEVLVTEWDYNDGVYSVNDVELAETVKIAGADVLPALVGNYVDYITNEDGEIAFIKVTSNVIKSDDIVKVDDDTVEVDDVEYDVVGGTVQDYTTYQNVFINEDGDVYDIVAVNAGSFDLVDEDAYDAEEYTLALKDATDKDFVDEDGADAYVVVKDGAYATLADLVENDVVSIDGKLIEVVTIADSGNLTAAYGDGATYDEVKIGGTKYDVAAAAKVSRDNGSAFDAAVNAAGLEDAANVKFFLNNLNEVIYIVADVEEAEEEATNVYGIVVDTTEVFKKTEEKPAGDWYVDAVKILLANGNEATYSLSDDADTDAEGDAEDFLTAAVDQFVVFTLDEAGAIETFAVNDAAAVNVAEVNEDVAMVKIGEWFDVTADTVVFKNLVDEDAEVVAASVIYDYAEEDVVYIANEDGELEYVIVTTEPVATEDGDYAMITDVYYNLDGDKMYVIDVKGTSSEYVAVDGEASVAGAVYEYDLVDGEIDFAATDVKIDDVTGDVQTVSVSKGYIEVNDTIYFVDEDTIIYNADDEYVSGISGITDEDNVTFELDTEDTDLITFLVINE